MATAAKKNVREALAGIQKIDGVEHIHGNIYRIRRDLLCFADSGLETADGKLLFGNPRYITNEDGKLVARGMSREEMEELRNEIIRQGLLHPPIFYPKDGKFVLADGERRMRCIDRIIKDDALAYNTATGEMEPASEVYEYIECRVEIMDVQKALEIAFTGNESAIGIGDGATLNVVRVLRKAEYDDDTILTITGKSITWLKETDELLQLDKETFDALISDRINRKVALKLSRVPVVKDRGQRLKAMLEARKERVEKKKQELSQEIEGHESALEMAESEVLEAEVLEQDVTEPELKVKRLNNITNKKKKQLNKLEENPPPVNEKDYIDTHDPNDDPKPYTPTKIEKYWKAELVDLIKDKGMDENDEQIVDVDDCRLVKSVLDAMLKGTLKDGKPVSLTGILKKHYSKKE